MSNNQNTNDLKYILNEKNQFITKEYIEGILNNFGIDIQIDDISKFKEATVHSSYLIRDEKFYSNNKTKPYQIQSNDIEPLDDISTAIPLHRTSLNCQMEKLLLVLWTFKTVYANCTMILYIVIVLWRVLS